MTRLAARRAKGFIGRGSVLKGLESVAVLKASLFGRLPRDYRRAPRRLSKATLDAVCARPLAFADVMNDELNLINDE
jgi:hypothetical protein